MLTFKNVNMITLVFFIVFILLKSTWDISFWWLFRLIILWLIVTVIGSFHIRWNYFLRADHKNDKIKENVIALTFDDGPHFEYTLQVLSLLQEYDAKATFFCIGKNIIKHPEIIKRILAEGHVIGNHSFIHSNNYGFLSTKRVLADIQHTQEKVNEITNLKLKFFRPPFGVTNPNIAKAIKILNLKTFGWSIRTYDTTVKRSEKIMRNIKSKIKKGDVILMHDTSEKSVDILSQLLHFLENNNFKSITLEELFNHKAYED